MAKETAEQKLLKILETSGQIPSGNPVSGGARPKMAPVKMQFSVKMLNTLLVIGIVVCLAMLGYEFQSGSALMHKQVDFSLDQPSTRHSLDLSESKPKDIAYYAQKISERNIFKPYEKEVLDKTNAPVKPTLAKKLSKYKLVGVAWLDLPETASVMFEDTASGGTLFLREGEKLDDVTIKAIYTDRAVLSYENEEITIKL
jgi:hypothetical protein